ncbi:hypothetical protein FHU41_002910 [Psychromicrobium silvestre]|uniref:Uncharacterized protein n=1 Tax=Psychromicrobium silvestre TaxID=1645614 RepID=A0A7Y9LW70_9MICC|nr:hypothetical protein [Psychromicrobium silvestre]NYE96660.1 hypothetical protein [Psychromicrobium silvestre]
MTTWTFAEIEEAFRASWSNETTCLDAKSLARWTPGNPAHGQCGPTALVVQDLLGGDLLLAEVTGGEEAAEVHYWNRLSEVEIDLTREQFSADRIIGTPRIVVRPPEGPRAHRAEYQLLHSRVFAALGIAHQDK